MTNFSFGTALHPCSKNTHGEIVSKPLLLSILVSWEYIPQKTPSRGLCVRHKPRSWHPLSRSRQWSLGRKRCSPCDMGSLRRLSDGLVRFSPPHVHNHRRTTYFVWHCASCIMLYTLYHITTLYYVLLYCNMISYNTVDYITSYCIATYRNLLHHDTSWHTTSNKNLIILMYILTFYIQ